MRLHHFSKYVYISLDIQTRSEGMIIEVLYHMYIIRPGFEKKCKS